MMAFLRQMLRMYLISDPFQLWEIFKKSRMDIQLTKWVLTVLIYCLKECFGISCEKKTYIRLSSLKSGWRFSRGNKNLKSIPILKNTAAISDNDGIQGQTGESLKVSS